MNIIAAIIRQAILDWQRLPEIRPEIAVFVMSDLYAEMIFALDADAEPERLFRLVAPGYDAVKASVMKFIREKYPEKDVLDIVNTEERLLLDMAEHGLIPPAEEMAALYWRKEDV